MLSQTDPAIKVGIPKQKNAASNDRVRFWCVLGAVCLALLWHLSGCQAEEGAVTTAIIRYLHAVHSEDYDALSTLWADLRRSELNDATGFQTRSLFKSLYFNYNEGKASGHHVFTSKGVSLIKGCMIGMGTFFTYERITVQDNRAEVVMRLALGYPDKNYDFPIGTTVYLMGIPLGTVYAIEIGRTPRRRWEFLKNLDILWNLEKIDGDWAITSVTPFEDTVRSVTVEQSF